MSAAMPARRLPVQKRWPAWRVAATQIGVLMAMLAAWEIAADTGVLSAFFWSQPSAIYHTLITFFAEGDAAIDISTTFEETLAGFALGTVLGSALGLSFWWSRNYAAVRSRS